MMRQKAIVTVGIVVGVLLALVLAISVASADPPPDRGRPAIKPDRPIAPKARIRWDTKLISQTLQAGDFYTATVHFTSTQTISNAVISIVPNIPARIKVIPPSFAVVQANTPTEVKIEISVPSNLRAGRQLKFNSMAYVKVGRTTLPEGLRIHVTVPKSSLKPPPPRR